MKKYNIVKIITLLIHIVILTAIAIYAEDVKLVVLWATWTIYWVIQCLRTEIVYEIRQLKCK